MQSVGDKIVDIVPTQTRTSVHGLPVHTNEPGSFAWFWASTNVLADESLLAVRPANHRSLDRDNRMAAWRISHRHRRPFNLGVPERR
jgi:hypothetical protein